MQKYTVEPHVHGPIKTFKYGGLPAIQVWGVDKAFTQLANYITHKATRPFDIIIELGADYGGLTNALADNMISEHAIIHSFDINKERFTNLWPEKIAFHCLDIYANFEFISKLFNDGRRVLVLCDGGDKPREYKEMIKWMNPGDMIMCHDYYPDRESFEQGKEIGRWNWWEFDDSSAVFDNSLKKPVNFFDEYCWFIQEKI